VPILHLNGYKISNPTVLARIEHEELEQFLRGCDWTPYVVEGDEPEEMHQLMAGTLEKAIEDIRQTQSNARNKNDTIRPRWPMIVLRSPKGWMDRKSSMVCKLRARSGRTRYRFWWIRSIPIMSSSLKAG